MDINKIYNLNNRYSDSSNSFYRPPKKYIDCRKLLSDRLVTEKKSLVESRKGLTTRQKLKLFPKKDSYIEKMMVRPVSKNPGPSRYDNNTYASIKRYKSQNTLIPPPEVHKKVVINPSNKRPTWIEEIQKYQKVNKRPSVGRYNLAEKSDFLIKKRSESIQNLQRKSIKRVNLDDVQFISASIPGPGHFNPHKSIPKLKLNPENVKESLKKHKLQQQREKKKLNESQTSSCSYSPVKDKTFESISKGPKRPSSFMRNSQTTPRQGTRSRETSPGPGNYDVLNKWTNQTHRKQKLSGQFNIFSRTTGSFPKLKIYS